MFKGFISLQRGLAVIIKLRGFYIETDWFWSLYDIKVSLILFSYKPLHLFNKCIYVLFFEIILI